MATALLAGLSALGSGCLTRKVSGEPPTTKINYNTVVRQSAIDKIDLLFAIDNSSSMGDKQALFAEAVPNLITRLLTPDCVDENGVKVARVSGNCPDKSKPEFNPVQDLHIGIVSSAIGSFGAPQCDPAATDNVGRPMNDKAQLLGRIEAGKPAPENKPSNFLTWLPNTEENKDKYPPKDGTTPEKDRVALQQDFTNLVRGVGQLGCGFEGQLESVYRFLVQPDPYAETVLPQKDGKFDPNATLSLSGVDNDILKQRATFLREDSLVAIVMLTDENENTIDPMALGGHAVLYEGPGTVKSGTPACTDPNLGPQAPMDGNCFSCYQENAQQFPCYQTTLPQAEDIPNVRFFEPKRRFGYDPRFPIERYVAGFSQAKVPDRRGEHPLNNNVPSFNYVGNTNCTNPLFAKGLPDPAKNADLSPDGLCNLPRGPRTADLVFFAIIGGVPWQMLTEDPGNLSDSNSAQFKPALNDEDWKRILGVDPLHYNFEGANPRMRESLAKREGVQAAGSNWRDWDTKNADLQYACDFPLKAPRDCTLAENKAACDCADPSTDSPLCDPTAKTKQIRGKAYPTISQLSVARNLRDQGIVASLCPRRIDDPNNEDYGYNPAVRTIVGRLKDALTERCIPQPLEEETDGTVPCLILELLPTPGDQATACDPARGLQQPDGGVLNRYRAKQRAENATQDELDRPLCAIKQLKGEELEQNSCETSPGAGWCYVSRTKVPTAKCAQSIKFSKTGTPPNGAVVNLQCIEQPPSQGVDGG